MMTRALYIFLFLFTSFFNGHSQNSINDYKYIIVPNQYEFLKEADQYQINSLTKFLFNKYGYTAYLQDEEFPQDLRDNRCLGLLSEVVKESGFLKTKLRIDLKDCNGNVVYSSRVGETREKEFSKAYNFALRDAFETFQNMNYKYEPNEKVLAKGSSKTLVNSDVKEKEEIARLKQEIEALKEDKTNSVEVEKPSKQTEIVERPTVVKQSSSQATVSSNTEAVTSAETFGMLYAQPIENGFQLVDMTPKKVMILKNSGVKDVFTVEGKKAIVYKKGSVWMYSESGDILKGEEINIKF